MTEKFYNVVASIVDFNIRKALRAIQDFINRFKDDFDDHATRHEDGGDDEIDLDGMEGDTVRMNKITDTAISKTIYIYTADFDSTMATASAGDKVFYGCQLYSKTAASGYEVAIRGCIVNGSFEHYSSPDFEFWLDSDDGAPT
jgi:hypothetical protein